MVLWLSSPLLRPAICHGGTLHGGRLKLCSYTLDVPLGLLGSMVGING